MIRYLTKWGLRFSLAPLLVAYLLVLTGGPETVRAQTGPGDAADAAPAVHGEVAFDLPKLTPQNPSASVTLNTPAGPVTLSAAMSDSRALPAEAGVATVSQRTCSAWYTIPATAAFGITNSFRYDYSSVTWMGSVQYNEWYVPPGHVDDEQTWSTWWPGIQYAFADGTANYVQGIYPFEIVLGHFHVWIQEDAWGNCTPHGTYGW